MEEEEPVYNGQQPEAKMQASPEISKKLPGDKDYDPIDMLIPESELPVDPNRLKKAIKTALIKNENNPDKIDIQSIMREQTRIHRQIQDFKQSRSKVPTQGGVTNNYFSSHIVKKIAEDKIHKSLKEITQKNLEQAFIHCPKPTGQLPRAKSTQSKEVLQKTPTKF